MKVTTHRLLLIAGLVWLIAGVNVGILGVQAFFNVPMTSLNWLLYVGALAIFVLFHTMIFSRMVSKHSNRIAGFEEEKTYFWRFFDLKSFVIMAIMMIGGIALRASHLVSNSFIAFFYTGLGLALALAGLSFLHRYFQGRKANCPFNPKQAEK